MKGGEGVCVELPSLSVCMGGWGIQKSSEEAREGEATKFEHSFISSGAETPNFSYYSFFLTLDKSKLWPYNCVRSFSSVPAHIKEDTSRLP